MFTIVFAGNAQDIIRKEVRVVQPYAPKLFDAYKINLLPSLEDTVRFSADFKYEISPKPYSSDYSIRPIKAARLLDEPLNKLYGSYLKLGLGNYLTPLAELSINKKRSKEYSFGAYGRHISSNSKVKLQNDEKVFAGFGNDELDLYGKRIWDNSVLSGSAGLDSRSVYYYGYNTEKIDTTLEKENIKQNFTNLNAQLGYHSTYVDSGNLNYDIQVRYDYLTDKFKYTENNLFAFGEFSMLRKDVLLGIDLSYNYIDESGESNTWKNNIVNLNPWFKKKTSEWRLKAGFDAVLEVNSDSIKTHFYPDALIQITVADNLIDAYFGITGKLEVNDFKKIAWENPFIKSGFRVRNTNHKLNVYGGLNGNISSSFSYKLRVSYKMIDDMYFYVNDTSDVLGNKFYTEYDDVQLTKVFGEISLRPVEHFSMLLRGNYYKYSMTDQAKPWHKPLWDLTVTTRYNLRDKILVNLDVIGSGKRYVKSYGVSGINESVLDGILDINFGIEYRYTKILSAFLRFYNLTSSGYQKWNRYPALGFMVIGGITYSL